MIRRSTLGLENQRLIFQIFHNNLQSAVVEKVCVGQAPADSRRLNSRTHQLADVPKFAVALILEQKDWLAISGADFRGIDLRVDVPVCQKKIWPAIVLPIDERV